MAEDDYLAQIIPLPRSPGSKAWNEVQADLGELPVLPDNGLLACSHDRSKVDQCARVVRCRDCDVVLDPIDVLAKIAHTYQNRVWHVHRLRSEREMLDKAVGELKRLEQNARSRISRVVKKGIETGVLSEKESKEIRRQVSQARYG